MLKQVQNTVTKYKLGRLPRTFVKGQIVNVTVQNRFGKKLYDVDGYLFAPSELATPNTAQVSSSFGGAEGIGKWHLIGHSVGFAGGIYYSFMKKTGFWKGLGITLIIAIAGGALGMGVDALINNQKETK